MQKQTSKWFFNIKVGLTPIMLFTLTGNSKPIMAIENDNDQPFKKENLEKDVKLDPQRLLKQSKIMPSKKKLWKVKVSIPKINREFNKSDKEIKKSYSKYKYPVIEIQEKINYFIQKSQKYQEWKKLHPTINVVDEKLFHDKIIKFYKDQLDLQKGISPNRKKDEMLEKKEMLEKEEILGKKNLVLKENPLLSTRSIFKKDYFLNNFEITSVLYKIEYLNLANRDKEPEIITKTISYKITLLDIMWL